MRYVAILLAAAALAGCAVPMGSPPLSEYRILNDDLVARIQPGQNREDVMGLLGPPVETMPFPRLGHTAWDYRYVDTWGYPSIFSVTFDARGVVVSKISRRIERERGFFLH